MDAEVVVEVLLRSPYFASRAWSPRHGRCQASQRFYNYDKEDMHSEKQMYAKLKEAGKGWIVEAPAGAGSIQSKLFYGRVSSAKMLRSYAHFKGW